MVIDARELPDGTVLESDLAIIGGGIAGITLARELMATGIRVLILESGGREPDRANQDFYSGTGVMTDPDGRTRDVSDYPRASRIRAYGGSGHVWGGKCGRLDLADFDRREWVPGSGWPFDRAHLDPYYDRASTHLALPSFRDDLTGRDPARPEVPIGRGRDFETVPRFHSRISGGRSRAEFDAFRFGPTEAASVTVCLGATVTGIETSAGADGVSGLVVRTLNGRTHRARARGYVLAAGGIENARLLLLTGVGNRSGMVGRNFGGHLNCSADGGDQGPTSGVSFARLPSSFDLYVTSDLAKVWGVVNATREALRTARLPNFWATFTAPWYQVPARDRSMETLGRLGSGSVDGQGGFFPVRVMVEQAPDPASRVTLVSGSRDALEQPRIHLDWKLPSSQFEGIERGVALFAKALGAAGVGRVRWPVAREAILPSLSPARHHLGTTRMSTDPTRGVVDGNGRVHGIDNFWIAGSSVFPTTGIVNPTLTIVALTVRLADHLTERLRSNR